MASLRKMREMKVYPNKQRHKTRKRSTRVSPPKGKFAKSLREDPCAYCNKVGPAGTVDHIEAGGPARWENLVGCCSNCNKDKQDAKLLFFLLGRAQEKGSRENLRELYKKCPKVETKDGVIGRVVSEKPNILFVEYDHKYPTRKLYYTPLEDLSQVKPLEG